MTVVEIGSCVMYAMTGGLAIGWIVLMVRSAYRRGRAM